MKRHLKKLTSILLCLVMFVNLFPTTAFAADVLDGITGSFENTADDDGVALKKSVVYDPDTETVTTTIETYTTGRVTSSTVIRPTDIVLVLDVSGSMNNSFGSGETNMSAMKKAVNAFIDSTVQQNETIQEDAQKHSIAIVKFADNSYYRSESNLEPGDHKSDSANYTEVLSAFTTVDAAGADQLKEDVAKLTAGGATAVDYGLTLASNLLSARATADNGKYADREKVVIVFTDGAPTHSSSYSSRVAYLAVNVAASIKSAGAKIYTIGIFDGANPADTSNQSNVFMNYVSSNYPKANGTTKTEYFGIFPYTVYELNAGAEPHGTGHYLAAADSSTLTNIFTTISAQIGRPDVQLGSSATLVDVVSEYFTIDGIGTQNPTISVQTADYLGGGRWADAETDSTIVPVLTGTDTITVNGFNFDENYISETPREGFYGKKLILTFVTHPNYEAIDAVSSFADAEIPTNDIAALLDSEGNAVDYIPSPELQAHQVVYQTVTDAGTTIIDSYYRLPGEEVLLIAKPADTATYTFGAWKTDDVALNEGDTTFEMPNADVVLTSTGTRQSYTVSYEYRGTVPAGTTPATAPATASYTVGDEVTHPSVTAPVGYTFSGWIEDDGDIATGVEDFKMLAENLHFYGYFIPNTNNSYKVEYYLMDTEGNYPEETTYSVPFNNVETGTKVTASILTPVGFTYDEDATTGANTGENVEMTAVNGDMVPTGTVYGNGELVLKVYLARNQHTVSYQYDGAVPEDANPSAAALLNDPYVGTFYYGEQVPIQGNASAKGYTFSGWRIFTGDTAIDNGYMTMPDSNVVLHGSFTATGDTPYKIEHYFEDLNGDYNKDTDLAPDSNREGYVGSTAYAEPLSGAQITGFTYDSTETGKHNTNMTSTGIPYGTITEDDENPLVLKLYYSRTRHKVTYQYTGTVPEGASALPAAVENVKYGETVYIANEASAPGYTFYGWNIAGAEFIIDETTNSFTMPARDVAFSGHFDPDNSKYTVEHYLENVDGSGYTLATTPTVYSTDVFVGQSVTANKNTYNTYTYSPTVTAQHNTSMTDGTNPESVPTGIVTADGSLVLQLYYTRNTYDITYTFANNPGNLVPPAKVEGVRHGATVNLADIEDPAGYTFDGWYYGTTYVGDSLTMPRENVTLVGRFLPGNNTPYEVHYYLQNPSDDGYTEDENASYQRTGTTGAYVVADTKEYPGFSFDTTQGAWNGYIQADGLLVLELYYNRNTYDVSYYYLGTPPTDTEIFLGEVAKPLTAPNALILTQQVRYGATVTVEPELTASDANYEFHGWYSTNLPGSVLNAEIAAGSTFTMPAHNVDLHGGLYNYTVYYNLDGGTLNGSETVNPRSVDWDSANLLPDGTPEKDNAIFVGWTFEDEPGYVTNADKYSELAVMPDTTFIVLKAAYVNGYTVTYDWGTENIPDGVTLPVDTNSYAESDSYSVDPTYPAGYTVDETDADGTVTGTYTFSGWTDPNGGTMGTANVTITGSWTYVAAWKTGALNVVLQDEEGTRLGGTEAPITITTDYLVSDAEGADVDYAYPASIEYNGKTYLYDGLAEGSAPLSGTLTQDGEEITVILQYTLDENSDNTPDKYQKKITFRVVNGQWNDETEEDKVIYVTLRNEIGAPSADGTAEITAPEVGSYPDDGYQAGAWDVTPPATVTGTNDEVYTYTYTLISTPPTPPTPPKPPVNPPKPPVTPGTGSVTLTKVDSADPTTTLSGVLFLLYDKNDKNLGAYQTGADGTVTVRDLTAGGYYWIEIRPKEGYVLDTTRVEFTISGGKTTEITVTNTRAEVPEVFSDDHYAYIIGRDDGLVHPEANITRAEAATVFFRLLNEETRMKYLTRQNAFTDVDRDDWFNTAVSTLAAMKIVLPEADGRFRPNDEITRAEFAQMAARFDKNPTLRGAQFRDIAGHPAEQEILIAAGNGWILGNENGDFLPDHHLSRAEIMAIVNRVLQRIPETPADLLPGMVEWPDNQNTAKWYYLAVQEATNSHYYERKQNGFETWTSLRAVRDWAALER